MLLWSALSNHTLTWLFLLKKWLLKSLPFLTLQNRSVMLCKPGQNKPHQRDVTNLLAAAVQACHDMVPPDAVEPFFKQIVNHFVHDPSRTESIAVGLNVVQEICIRIPLETPEDGGWHDLVSNGFIEETMINMDFEACSKLEDLNLEVRTSLDKNKENLDESFKRQDEINVPIHEVIFSAIDKPKLLSQLKHQEVTN